MARAAVVFGATGRLGRVMLQSLSDLGVEAIAVTRPVLTKHIATGALPALPEHIMLIDASVDYAHLRQHEADKHTLIAALAQRTRIELVAAFSSGATDFDDALITNPSYLEYKRVKEQNLVFFQSLGARLFYPKIYTLIGPNSYGLKTIGWVSVLDQALRAGEVSIAHPNELRSWVSERAIRTLFAAFVAADHPDYLDAPVCGTFCLADIVGFCEVRRGCRLAIKPGQAAGWLQVPYVAPRPTQVGNDRNLQAELESLLDSAASNSGTRGK
ncbi:MAG TPA: hypothetical protein VGV09_20610 [Steroidobacteraceae bacterium]|nr:hypothetical protein [Steroidobacteraceae bacterium]